MIALLLLPPGDGADHDTREVTDLLERVQRPAILRLRWCEIEWGSFGTLVIKGHWSVEITHNTFLLRDGPDLVIESWPGIEIDWCGTPSNLLPVTIQQLAAEVERQRLTLQAKGAA